MRARTKVAEWWEVETHGLRIGTRWRKRDEARGYARDIEAGKVYHVTRYRLAPLVDVKYTRDGVTASFDVWHPTDHRVLGWYMGRLWRVGDDGTNREETEEDAKAACAARLRELGYRVVDQ